MLLLPGLSWFGAADKQVRDSAERSDTAGYVESFGIMECLAQTGLGAPE